MSTAASANGRAKRDEPTVEGHHLRLAEHSERYTKSQQEALAFNAVMERQTEALQQLASDVNGMKTGLDMVLKDRTVARRIIWAGLSIAGALATTALCRLIWNAIGSGAAAVIIR